MIATILHKMSTRPYLISCQKLFKHTIDHSLVPKIYESDLEEKFVRGSGPGGSAVNKNANCVVLIHKPSGLVIKCHASRCLDDNRKTARQTLAYKLDDIENGSNSVSAQKQRVQERKSKNNDYKKRKLDKMKAAWKEREDVNSG